MPEGVRIKLNKEQTLKFYSFLVDDAIRIANERKRAQNANINIQNNKSKTKSLS